LRTQIPSRVNLNKSKYLIRVSMRKPTKNAQLNAKLKKRRKRIYQLSKKRLQLQMISLRLKRLKSSKRLMTMITSTVANYLLLMRTMMSTKKKNSLKKRRKMRKNVSKKEIMKNRFQMSTKNK
jgi:hypothetical protein